MLSFGLRVRVVVSFAILSLAVAAAVSGATYVIASWYLTGERSDSALIRASLDARAVNSALAAGSRPGEALAVIPVVDGSQPMLRVGDTWFTSTVAVPPDSLPADLLAQAEAEGAQQRIEVAGDPYLVIGLPTQRALFVEVFPLRTLDRTLVIGGWGLVAVTVLAGALGALLGWYSVRRLLVPVDQLGNGARSLAAGDLDVRLPAAGDPDLDPIASAFNEMADSVQTRIAREQRFAANVSHELRSPMTAISGVTELLEDRAPDMDPRDAGIVEHLARQVRRLSRMLIDLLEISRMTAAENVEVEPVDVARMLTQILQQHGVDLAIMVGERPVVRTDGRHLERVFDNIVRNAESHGAGLRCVEILSDSHAVTVRIRDSGPGIDEELAKRLFEPFVRGDQADPTSGAGLGMAIALEHAGVIHAGLEVGRAEEGGAQFVVSVPWEISA